MWYTTSHNHSWVCVCYTCHLFGSGDSCNSWPEQILTVDGFKDWKHAMGINDLLAMHPQ